MPIRHKTFLHYAHRKNHNLINSFHEHCSPTYMLEIIVITSGR